MCPPGTTPERNTESSVGRGMAIDKESSGLPEVDLKRRTTKVNLWMIIGVALFFVIAAGLVMWFARTG